MEDPTNKVRRKPKKDRAKLNTSQDLPEFSSTRYADVEKENYQISGADMAETAYLKRLSLRKKLEGSKFQDYVPDLSDLELETGRQMAMLNAMNRSADPSNRASLELLFSRFNSRSLFQISTEISKLRLSKQSLQELEQLVMNGPVAMVGEIVGTNQDSFAKAKDRSRGDFFKQEGPRTK